MANPWDGDQLAQPDAPWANDQLVSTPAAPAGPAQYSGPAQFNVGPVHIDPLRDLRIAGESVTKGAAETLGIPGDLESLANHFFPAQMAPIENALGSPSDKTWFPTSEDIIGAVKGLHATGSPEFTPQGGEKYLAAPAEGAGAGLPFMNPTAVGAGAVGGLASQIASDALPDVPWAPTVAGIVAGAGFGAGMTSSTLRRLATAQGVRKELGAAAQNYDVVSTLAQDNAKALQDDAMKRVSGLAKVYGSGKTFDGAGQDLQQGIANWANKNGGVKPSLPAGPSSPVAFAPNTNLLSEPDPTRLVEKLISAGPAAIQSARTMAPTEMNEVASAFLTPQKDSVSGPAGWRQLDGPTRAALVPDPADRAEINAAVDQHFQAPVDAANAVKPAAVRLAAAQAAHSHLSAPPAKPNALGAILGEQIGRHVVGTYLSTHGTPPWIANALGGIGGALVPSALRATSRVVQSPMTPLIAGLGAHDVETDGPNALMGQ